MSVFGGFVYNVVRSHAMPNYSYACAADTNEGNWWIAYRVFIAADLYIGPNMASLAVAVLLFMRIRFELVSRAVLLHVTHSEAGSARPLSLGQISGALTAVVMAVAHATFYLPGGSLAFIS